MRDINLDMWVKELLEAADRVDMTQDEVTRRAAVAQLVGISL